MSWIDDFDWKVALKTIAPTIASIFGTPLAGAGVAALLEAIFPAEDVRGLSQQEQEEKLATVLKSGSLTPEAFAAMKQADLAFKTRCLDAGIDIERISAADRQDARARDIEIIRAGRTNDRANVMLAMAYGGIITISVIAACYNFLGLDPAGIVMGFLITIGGALLKNVGTAFDFEFGSSRGSQIKTDALASLAANPAPSEKS